MLSRSLSVSYKKQRADPVQIVAKSLVDRGIKICYNETTDRGRIVAWENKQGKVTDVFFRAAGESSVRVAQTTGSIWDNFTKPESICCPVENTVFGLHKLLCSIKRVEELGEEDDKHLEILVPKAVADWVAKKPHLAEDPVAVYCSKYEPPAEPVTDFEQAKADWLKFHRGLVDLMYATHPSIAKLVIGRKMPFAYFEKPFERAIYTTVSSFRTVQLSMDTTDLCTSLLSDLDEEFSWSDKLYAHEVGPEIKPLGPLCCFKPNSGDAGLEAQKEAIREQVEAHMWAAELPKHKLGKINLTTRNAVMELMNKIPLSFSEEVMEELTACGWPIWVQKHTGQDPFDIVPEADMDVAAYFQQQNRFDEVVDAMLDLLSP